MGGKGDHGIAGWKWFHPGFDSLLKHPFLEKASLLVCLQWKFTHHLTELSDTGPGWKLFFRVTPVTSK